MALFSLVAKAHSANNPEAAKKLHILGRVLAVLALRYPYILMMVNMPAMDAIR